MNTRHFLKTIAGTVAAVLWPSRWHVISWNKYLDQLQKRLVEKECWKSLEKPTINSQVLVYKNVLYTQTVDADGTARWIKVLAGVW